MSFVHLHLHTEFSLIDGTLRIKPMLAAAKERGLPALALTDQANLFAMVKFYEAARKSGIKPILGADCLVVDEPGSTPYRVVLLAQNNLGFRHLTELLSRGYCEGQIQDRPMLRREWLTQEQCAGLIALSGGHLGEIGQLLLHGKARERKAAIKFWTERFPDRFYLELTRCGRPDEEKYLHAAVELAEQAQLPVVATNDVRFLDQENFEAHEVRVCIQQGRVLDDPRRPHDYTALQYLRPADEMQALFADIPEAIENSLAVAERCNVTLQLGKNFLPNFPTPNGETEADYLRTLSEQGLAHRFERVPAEQHEAYRERLNIELDVIIQMGFSGYFLIVADFIQWAKRQGIPVGPGRGSGAGSLVAWALLITDIDPIPYDLLFERFLNPERVSMPDFDIDFCMEGRDRVIDYVAERYGRAAVSQIATHGTMAAKAVVRDVGRVMSYPYGFVDRIAKLIPMKPGLDVTLEDALGRTERSQKEQERFSQEFRDLYERDEEVRAIVDMGMALEGLSRNVGKHAGGVVIAPSKLTDFTPMYCESNGASAASQLDKDDVEAVGLVKFDFLGLRNLTIIDWALGSINATRQKVGKEPVDITVIPLDDKPSFNLLKRCETTAVFQLESRGMKDLIRRLQPDTFEDIIALVALFRPGPLQSGMVDDFILRKKGEQKIEYLHPWLTDVLKPTYGVIVYQEQVMQIAQILAGYTLGGADLLRRAMGKKKPEEMAKQREIFLEGAKSKQVDPTQAGYIFDLMEKFAGYGFNKSHSAAYALVAYQTAWLKAHYPAHFMAAVLSADMDNTDKIVGLIGECQRMGLNVIPPDVNHCAYKFQALDEHTVVYGLGAIKGVGEGVIQKIVEERQAGAPFVDMNDFCHRVGSQALNKRVLEAMVLAGALDTLGPNRASLFAHIPDAMKAASQIQAAEAAGMGDLFGGFDAPETAIRVPIPALEPWPDAEQLRKEKDTLGLYLTGHPIHAFRDELKSLVSDTLSGLLDKLDIPAPGTFPKGVPVTVAGLAIAERIVRQQNGDRQLFLTLDDGEGRCEVRITGDEIDRISAQVERDQLVIVEGDAVFDNFSGGIRVRCKRLLVLEQARLEKARGIFLEFAADCNAAKAQALIERMRPMRCDGVPLSCRVYSDMAKAVVRLGPEWQIAPTDDNMQAIRSAPGVQSARVLYQR
ncbi:DNA polymerase III subunit alpha [Halothiobacillus neapolitanus]|uniref:DNA polymerase III subunit alpha n=1 Tax=Halothiobacillus neapolitanus (strain ATCC 23641 / DSM 15147 / CIP 104769 / NCIMB 8539 / c2) TaxID=555778 RepID=D0KYB4_HALNC|nr:DNA polymerase III subunit alpha [Halothiobacillus neapolitanus]ACX95437.1 DNA polymerase III, alpha subunit [Halothiobacillus neapolitanus c2]TDN65735.1 DNA polymerase III alpha subunit [Halothiobacillus neapolitanus]